MTPRSTSAYLLMATLLLQGLSGLAGGLALVADPTGALLNLPLDWLAGSPFDSYLIPGLILLLVLGVGPLLVLHGLWRRRPWATRGALLVGLALLIWIGVEVLVVGYQPTPPLQLIYGLLGVLILLLAARVSVGRPSQDGSTR